MALKYPILEQVIAETISKDEAMKTPEGKLLYAEFAAYFNAAWAQLPKDVRDTLDQRPTYLGSEKFIEGLVWIAVNKGEMS
jgi:hypothetical protein